MKILVLGRNGQVGFELQRALLPLGDVIAPPREDLDLATAQAVDRYLEERQPDLVVNAAAYTAVDLAETHPDEARRLNTELPRQLARYAASHGARLVHYSSDYVYPGTGDMPWTENDATQPLNVYGQTKLEGDEAIVDSGADALIFRTSWVYSARGNNFMKTMLRLAQSKPELSIVSDQVGTPTPARLIAEITALAVYGRLNAGIYHLAPTGETSWQGFAQEIFRLTQQAGKELMMGPEKALPIPTRDYPTPAQRPLNSRLSVSKLEKALGIRMPNWQTGLAQTLDEYLEK